MATTGYGSTYVSGTDLVANYPAASLLVAQGIDSAGYYIGRGNNTQTGSMTTVLTDAGKTITMTAAGANTVTIPANSSVAYVIGTRINILNLGAGACTPTAAAGVTIAGTITALATNQAASVIKTATNTWSYVPFSSGTAAAVITSSTGSPTITTDGTATVYKFTGDGTIVVGTAGVAAVVCGAGAGGGGAGTGIGGGGGAGGIVSSFTGTFFLPAGTLTVKVGAGGAANAAAAGGNGGFSQVGAIYAVGGGGGGFNSGAGLYGGSGGGGATAGAASGAGGLGQPGQGFAGGAGVPSVDAAGGGGATAVGTSGTGGAGITTLITGASQTIAIGGGCSTGPAATAGAANTSNGGQGGYVAIGGAGGSGVVYVRVG